MSLVAFTIAGCIYLWAVHTCAKTGPYNDAHLDTSGPDIDKKQPVSIPRQLCNFREKITADEKNIIITIFDEAVKVFRSYNISYHLQYGTLIGAYRHGGIMPWDTDIDISVDVSDRPFIEKIFIDLAKSSAQQKICYLNHGNFLSRIYSAFKHGPNSPDECFDRWPRVDIFYHSINDDGINYLCDSIVCPPTRLNVTRIFPLKMIQFESRLHPAPRDIEYVIEATYKRDVTRQCCNFKSQCYVDESLESVCVDCSDLRPYYKFVK